MLLVKSKRVCCYHCIKSFSKECLRESSGHRLKLYGRTMVYLQLWAAACQVVFNKFYLFRRRSILPTWLCHRRSWACDSGRNADCEVIGHKILECRLAVSPTGEEISDTPSKLSCKGLATLLLCRRACGSGRSTDSELLTIFCNAVPLSVKPARKWAIYVVLQGFFVKSAKLCTVTDCVTITWNSKRPKSCCF